MQRGERERERERERSQDRVQQDSGRPVFSNCSKYVSSWNFFMKHWKILFEKYPDNLAWFGKILLNFHINAMLRWNHSWEWELHNGTDSIVAKQFNCKVSRRRVEWCLLLFNGEQIVCFDVELQSFVQSAKSEGFYFRVRESNNSTVSITPSEPSHCAGV